MQDDKLTCKKCGRLRRTEKFGDLNKNTPVIKERGNKNLYCKDCMSIYRKVYAKENPIGYRKTVKAIKRYKKRNKSKIKEYNKNYYKENKDRIMYNLKCRRTTECVMIFDDDLKKASKQKINKDIRITKKHGEIEINPQRK